MKVIFTTNTEQTAPEIDYGTILLCKYTYNDSHFDLFRVSNVGPYPEKFGLAILHDESDIEKHYWGSTYDSISEMIRDLKKIYTYIEVADAHVVIDEVIGRL